ncbi:MAG: hypothetical protein KJ906_00925, partial [Nanoarchaeota archaeon]|nr:hypothetical protein [Nanoarchaeota archaeon]
KFPNKITKEIMYLAKYMRIVKGARKVRIVSKYGNENVNMRKIKRIVKNSFNLNVNKDGYIFSKYFELFFDTFFEYKHIRNPITKTEADKLKNDLQNKWAT